MDNSNVHYKYAISYLLGAIVLLISLSFFEVPDLVDKLSFALTLSSLLLAILAIFYTIVSANKQDSQFSKLIETNSEIRATANEMKLISSGINNLLESVPTHFEKMGAKLDLINEQYNSPNDDSTPSENTSNGLNITEIKIDDNILQKMICHLQYAAMGVLYLFIQSHNKNKPINFSTISELELISPEYAIGVLNGFETTGLIDFKLHEAAIISTKCETILVKNVPSILREIIKSLESDEGINLEKKMNNIDKLWKVKK